MVYKNSYFDKDDFAENYIFYIDDSLVFDVESDRNKKAEIYLMISELGL